MDNPDLKIALLEVKIRAMEARLSAAEAGLMDAIFDIRRNAESVLAGMLDRITEIEAYDRNSNNRRSPSQS